MFKILSKYKYNITNAGGSVSLSLDYSDLLNTYDICVIGASPAVTIASDMEFITTGTALEGMYINIEYTGGVTSDYLGGRTVSFFGVDLTDAQAASKCKITAYYDGSAWNVQVNPDLSEQQTQPVLWGYLIEDETIDKYKIADGKITLPKLADLSAEGYLIRGGSGGTIEEFDASTDGYTLIGDGTTVNSVAISGDISLINTGVATIANNAITTVKVLDDNITVAKVENNLKYELITRDVSFETGEVGDFKIKMPYSGSVSEIYAYVTKAIAGTDDATIVPKDNAGTTMTAGTVTFTAGDPRGTAETTTPSANNTFSNGHVLTFTCAKTTAGGKATISIKIIRS